MLNNKAFNRVMQQEIGIIGTIENKIKKYYNRLGK